MSDGPREPLILDPDTVLSKYDPASKINQYLDLIEQENQKINLVSRETGRTDLVRLAAESLAPFEIIPKRKFENYIDIGSGGGLPSFPILLSLEIINSVLIERTKKKAAALVRISKSLNLAPTVLDQNLDECKLETKFDLVTLRLVRLSAGLLSQIEKILSPDGVFIYYAHFDGSIKKTRLKSSSYTYTIGQDSPVKSFTVFTR